VFDDHAIAVGRVLMPKTGKEFPRTTAHIVINARFIKKLSSIRSMSSDGALAFRIGEPPRKVAQRLTESLRGHLAGDVEDDVTQVRLLDRFRGFGGREPAAFAFFLLRPILLLTLLLAEKRSLRRSQ
jgi:hypothetical protein